MQGTSNYTPQETLRTSGGLGHALLPFLSKASVAREHVVRWRVSGCCRDERLARCTSRKRIKTYTPEIVFLRTRKNSLNTRGAAGPGKAYDGCKEGVYLRGGGFCRFASIETIGTAAEMYIFTVAANIEYKPYARAFMHARLTHSSACGETFGVRDTCGCRSICFRP